MSINLGILAHVDAGKTTLTEALLYHSGVTRHMGRVDSGTTITDSMLLERQRGMTIRASTVSFEWQNIKINLIDTPGHMDFIAEVERSLAVLDGVILVISGREGVQPQTRVLFRKLRERSIPTLLFLNKLDRIGVNLDKLRQDIFDLLSPHAVYLQDAHDAGTRDFTIMPCSFAEGYLHEAAISLSDALLERYLSNQPITADDCRQSLVSATRQCRCFPVLLGSALHDIGVTDVLPAITTYFEEKGDPQAALSALVYKVEWADAHKRCYMRLFTGTLHYRQRVTNELMIKALYTPCQGTLIPTKQVQVGDIAVLMDVPSLHCGDWLGARPVNIAHETAVPLLTSSVEPPDDARRMETIIALRILADEDPFLEFHLNEETDELSVRLFGALQVEILQALLLERFSLPITCTPPKVIYKERPLGYAEAFVHIFTPGNHLAAGIGVSVEPLPPGSGSVYENRVSYGDLQESFQNAVREGVMQGIANGLYDGAIDLRVTFIGMEFSSVTSTPADYRKLAPQVVRMALEKAGVRRVTPWQTFELTTPLIYQKAVLRLLTDARATLETVAYGDIETQARGIAPLDSFLDFPRQFLTATAGQGVLETAFAQYR